MFSISMPMPSSRHLQSFFFFLSFIISNVVASQNLEASFLISWLQSSSSHSFSNNWNSFDATPCNWTSIKCSASGFVSEITIQSVQLQLSIPTNLSSFKHLQKLVISGANLTGSIPFDLGDCVGLTVIDLSSNNLVGSIPSSLGKLHRLEELILNSNKLIGKIPVELSDCRSLRILDLFTNRLGGSIPPELGRLASLEELRAGGNKDIVGNIPAELGDCSNMTYLGLADTRVSGWLPASLGKLRKLQTLAIYTTMISGEIPAEIGNCSELLQLLLFENSLSGLIPPDIGKLRKLEDLLLWKNSLVGGIPEEIGNCTSLRTIDLSLNSLSGTIPLSIGGLSELEKFMVSNNNVSGTIPANLANATNLVELHLANNHISGSIPPDLGMLSKLTVFLAWENQLEGSIPSSLASISNLLELDLSHNSLTGSIPADLFQLQKLEKLVLISNGISGFIPPDIGNCSSLVRLRLGNNGIAGLVPREIGALKRLAFLDLSSNRLSGPVPYEIGDCTNLEMINLCNNTLEGPLPNSLSFLSHLQVLDVSCNRFLGQIPASLGRLVSLNKLILSMNSFSGSIPSSFGLCSRIQLLDLSSNQLTGSIPAELCQIEALEIALNLSCNGLTGPIPAQLSALTKLSILDLSHNKLEGNLSHLAQLHNLVSLNISYNKFSGYLPDNQLFRQLSPTDLAGNEGLCSFGNYSCFASDTGRSRKIDVAIALSITMMAALAMMGTFAVVLGRLGIRDDDDSELGHSWPWKFTPFQKLNFSVEQVLKCLIDANVIGKGSSGIVYRAEMDNGEVIAVKKLWPTMSATKGCNDDKPGVQDSFSAEINTLGAIRHKNIIRLLGFGCNQKTRLLLYDYMPNGSLGSLLHERTGNALEWELRYQILLGTAEGLAYLHHDSVPPILHRDIKPSNILVGPEFEPCIADFGIAKVAQDGEFGRASNGIAGSYGYIAPEYGYMMKITEKADVYSYGVVVLEVLTGKQPIDPTIPNGSHIVDWVRRRRAVGVLDRRLLSRPDPEIDEMTQALGIALLCVNASPDDRPTMKDVAAMLKEIKPEREEKYAKVDVLLKGSPSEKNSSFVAPATSSSKRAARPGNSLLPRSNNSSFSGSSLLYSSAISSRVGFK